jgi:serine protease Do
MRTRAIVALVSLAGVVFGGGAGTEKGKDNKDKEHRSAVQEVSFARETPTVLAVRKTREGIVTLKITKPGASKETVGTGIIIDERGYIVTNRHVVKNATPNGIRVVLFDRSSHKASVAFTDASHDLAVIRIETAKKLKALRLGPANDLMVGEEVIAIGHPFGYTNSVSRGIISAVDREIEMPGGITLTGLIQTTASINPGNSGGPLLNINGEVIGLNVALRQDAQGIAFALNADTVQQVLSRKLSASLRTGFYHGLDCREAERVNPQGRARVMVHDVAEGTPASAAGLRSGDELLRLGGYEVVNRFDVERALWDAREGGKVVVTVVRHGRQMTIDMPLGRDVGKAPRVTKAPTIASR